MIATFRSASADLLMQIKTSQSFHTKLQSQYILTTFYMINIIIIGI